MKYVLSLFSIVICNIACNQQVVKNVSSISKDEKNIVTYSPDSVDFKDTSNDEHSEITSKQKNPKSIINNDGESLQEMFTLLSASSKSWISGLPDGDNGIEYYFKLKIHTSQQLSFDSAWINNDVFTISISKETSTISNRPVTINNGDIVTLRITDLQNRTIRKANVKAPIDFNGAALISYKVDDTQKYLIIKEIHTQSPIYRK
jgi:hypothetical protein